jgi:hypothetical protein
MALPTLALQELGLYYDEPVPIIDQSSPVREPSIASDPELGDESDSASEAPDPNNTIPSPPGNAESEAEEPNHSPSSPQGAITINTPSETSSSDSGESIDLPQSRAHISSNKGKGREKDNEEDEEDEEDEDSGDKDEDIDKEEDSDKEEDDSDEEEDSDEDEGPVIPRRKHRLLQAKGFMLANSRSQAEKQQASKQQIEKRAQVKNRLQVKQRPQVEERPQRQELPRRPTSRQSTTSFRPVASNLDEQPMPQRAGPVAPERPYTGRRGGPNEDSDLDEDEVEASTQENTRDRQTRTLEASVDTLRQQQREELAAERRRVAGLDFEHFDIAKVLASQMLHFQGCADGQHATDMHLHQANDKAISHRTLDYFATAHRTLPKTLTRTEAVMSKDEAFLIPDDKWQKHGRLYSGLLQQPITADPDIAEIPSTICVPCTESAYLSRRAERHQAATVSFDIDSVQILATSLDVLRMGLDWWPAPARTSNLQGKTRLQLERKIYSEHVPDVRSGNMNDDSWVPLESIPHFCLGSVEGFPQLFVYVIFPDAYDGNGSYMSNQELTEFHEKVLYPAVLRNQRNDQLNHLLKSYKSAQQNVKAKSAESTHLDVNKEPRQRALREPLQSESLRSIWREVVEKVEGHRLFHRPILYIQGKNLKALTKARRWNNTYDKFFTDRFSHAFNIYKLNPDRVWLDTAAELMPSMLNQTLRVPETYLWRPCCLKTFVQKLRNKGGGVKQHTFYSAFLKDIQCYTLEPSTSSLNWRQGLAYAHFYNCDKELFDKLKTFPFHDHNLEMWGLDHQVRKHWVAQPSLSVKLDAKFQQAYLNSKARITTALETQMDHDIGPRWEFRTTLRCFRRIHDYIVADLEEYTEFTIDLEDGPFWQLATATWLRFLMTHVNRLTTGLEFALARSSSRYRQWPASELICAFIRSARFALIGTNMSREISLWKGAHTSTRSAVVDTELWGLDLKTTSSRYGYGWFPIGAIDWTRGQFTGHYAHNTMFGNIAMRNHVRLSSTVGRDTEITGKYWFEDRAEQLLALLDTHHGVSDIRARLIELLVFTVIAAFRWGYWSNSNFTKNSSDAIIAGQALTQRAGKTPVSWNSIHRMVKPSACGHSRFHAISHTKQLDNVALRADTTPQDRLQRFFVLKEEDPVGFFPACQDSAHLIVYHRIGEALDMILEEVLRTEFNDLLWDYFPRLTWVIPQTTTRAAFEIYKPKGKDKCPTCSQWDMVSVLHKDIIRISSRGTQEKYKTYTWEDLRALRKDGWQLGIGLKCKPCWHDLQDPPDMYVDLQKVQEWCVKMQKRYDNRPNKRTRIV